MKKMIKYFQKYVLVSVSVFAFLFVLICAFLFWQGLMFRQWAYFLFIPAMSLGFIVGVGQLVFKLRQKFWKILGIVLWGIFSWFLVSILFVIGIFSYMPEYVVEKNGRKYVAYVHTFHKTRVYYYEYKNFLIVGGDKRFEEFYGKTLFYPDNMDLNEKNVKSVIYFNQN